MSPSGVAFRWVTRGEVGDAGLSVPSEPISDGAFSVSSGSGDTEGCGVGSEDDSSSAIGFVVGATDIRLFLFARTLCRPLVVRFLGEDFLMGEAGSVGSTFSDASKISGGSIDSVARVLRVRVPVFGVGGSSTVFLLEPRVARAGAGVKSSLSLFVSGV
jgi:hypothetical protein